ncbi:MAG: helix-turn-helix domain-containing protein [Pseudomonadota bacterium]
MTWRYWLMAAVFCIPIWIARFDVQGFFDIITGTHIVLLNVYALCLFIYLIIDILRGRIDDLIEPRRRLRVFFVFGLVLLTILSIASEFILIGDAYNLQVPFKMIVISALTVSAYLWILQVRPDHFAFNQTPQSTSELDNTEQTEPLTQREQALKEALDHQMQDENVWLNPTLNIVGLAGKLAVTEHRLRRFINKRLGYRNFSSYINDYRIDAIKEALDQLEKRDIPILTIALDHGFNSLPPFNRAFKLREGVTPSVYRARLRQPAETH